MPGHLLKRGAWADGWGALAWIALGGAITVGAWNMDRLEKFQVKSYEAPGLVPGLLGVLVMLLGVVLLVRAALAARQHSVPTGEMNGTSNALASERSAGQIIAIGTGLSLTYALLLVGRGTPFWLATFGYVALFVTLLDGDRQRALGRSARAIAARAVVFSAVVSGVVTTVFQHVFLVRLP